MTTAPLAYFWGDDDYVIGRQVDRLVAKVDAETGMPMERWDPWADARPASQTVALLAERLTTATMFGGGTFVVVRKPGPLIKRNEDRDALVGAIANVAAGNGIAVIDVHRKDAKSAARRYPPHKRLADAITKQGGTSRQVEPPTGGAFIAFVRREAEDRGLRIEPRAATRLTELIGGADTEGDVERRYQTRRASTELDKLALFAAGRTITVDDVQALVAPDEPPSIFALTDAVGRRDPERALDAMDRALGSLPEPVILVMLHRLVRNLLEVGERIQRGDRDIVAATGLHSFVVEKMAAQSPKWASGELAAALEGLLEIDAMVKHAPGYAGTDAQRRMAFTLWVMDHVPREARPAAGGRTR